ncbi:MAG: carboxylating nicotinate-nucleotide diphosphorylase [Ignavibacteria bacterium]|nr:carboxylating nicotinate-nucleotide diphosphorylase [Ignavibacteria bacterium]
MNYYKNFDFVLAEKLIKLALKEDIGKGDITSDILISNDSKIKADILLKEQAVIAGLKIFERVYKLVDGNVKIKLFAKDGIEYQSNTIIGTISGNTKNILKCERLSLNILQRMSGIATYVNRLVKKLNNPDIKILDTRKTTPNFRIFEKLAVRIGGGYNHRAGLYDMILIKDNHIAEVGGILNVINILGSKKIQNYKVEIEVKNIDEFKTVHKYGKNLFDIIMLDNFSIADIKKVVEINKGIFKLEISGGINLDNISLYSGLYGIDYISVGSLTHSYKSIDISLEFENSSVKLK